MKDYVVVLVALGDLDGSAAPGQVRLALGLARLEELDHSREAVGDVAARAGVDTAEVEGPHGELRAGLADRLRGDDADGLAYRHPSTGSQVAPVTGGAHTVLGPAGQDRADDDLLDLTLGQSGGDLLADVLVGIHQQGALGLDLVERVAAHHAGVDLAVHGNLYGDAAGGAAVLLAHDDVLCDVHQAAGQVAGVGRPQRCIGKALPGTVRADEILQNG